MNKTMIGMLLALCLTLSLTACGGGGGGAASAGVPSGGQSQPAAQSAAQSAASGGEEVSGGYVFTAAGGYNVQVDADMADVLAALGEPQSYFEAASCAFEGLDKTYTYAGFTIVTRPDGEKDYVNSILLTDDSVTTPEGVYIGCTAEDVTAAYGEGTQTDTMITYTQDGVSLNFVLEGGKVVSIEYLPA